jgi:hypothetical protein
MIRGGNLTTCSHCSSCRHIGIIALSCRPNRRSNSLIPQTVDNERFERSDVPFVPSQTAQPEGGTIVTLSSAPRLNAEGGGNHAITVLAGASGAFISDVAMVMTSALELPALQPVCRHRTSADVMAITERSIAFARPNLADAAVLLCWLLAAHSGPDLI